MLVCLSYCETDEIKFNIIIITILQFNGYVPTYLQFIF